MDTLPITGCTALPLDLIFENRLQVMMTLHLTVYHPYQFYRRTNVTAEVHLDPVQYD